MYSESDQVIALAGVFQAARITWQLARKGVAEASALRASIDSLFQRQPDSVVAVFGGAQGVETGLRCLVNQLDDQRSRDVEITQYVILLLQLARRLRTDRGRLEILGAELNDLQERLRDYNLDERTRFAQLGKIYENVISKLSPRIMVRGEPAILQNADNAARIRAVLLAGVRAGHLWYQCGGSRWKLLLRRRRIVETAREILRSP